MYEQQNKFNIKKLKAFWADENGVASIEFILTLPVLFLLFFGCVELYGHFNAIRKLGNVTASLADIVAQSRSVTKTQLDALRPLAKSLMAPIDASEISYTITNVRQGPAGDDPDYVWEHEHLSNGISNLDKGSAGGACDEYTGAPNSNDFPPNQDTIYVQTEFTYTSLFTNFITGPTVYTDSMLAVPRASTTVRITDVTLCN